MVVRIPLAAVEVVYEPGIEGTTAAGGRWMAEMAKSHLELAFGLSTQARIIGTGHSLSEALERLVGQLYEALEREEGK